MTPGDMVIRGCSYFLLIADIAAIPFEKTVFTGSIMPFSKVNAMVTPSPSPEQIREQRTYAIQRRHDNDTGDDRYIRYIIKEGIFVFPHDFLVIKENDQKDQCGR